MRMTILKKIGVVIHATTNVAWCTGGPRTVAKASAFVQCVFGCQYYGNTRSGEEIPKFTSKCLSDVILNTGKRGVLVRLVSV